MTSILFALIIAMTQTASAGKSRVVFCAGLDHGCAIAGVQWQRSYGWASARIGLGLIGVSPCDGKDNDCDDELPSDEADNDGDGYVECIPVSSWTDAMGGDCDDGDDDINPAGTEECDGEDNNCDGTVDEEGTYHVDSDGDGYGDPNVTGRGECDIRRCY